MSTATAKNLIQQLIFGGTLVNPESIEEGIEKIDEEEQLKGARRPSAYIDVFENMVKTILEHEPWLLSDQEVNVLEQFSQLSYNTRYCLVRLVLRKANHWHPISSLHKFKKEIGEDGLLPAIADLCQPIASILKHEPLDDPKIKIEPVDAPLPSQHEVTHIKIEDDRGVVDLTMDTDDEEESKPDVASLTGAIANYWAGRASTSKLPIFEDPIQALLQSGGEMDLDFFCEDESVMSLDELLWRLTLDQLKKLTKATKCKLKPSAKKSDIIRALQDNATTQRVLNFGPTQRCKGKGKAGDDGLRQTMLPFPSLRPGKKSINQAERLREMAVQELGKCVRVNFDFFRLVRRLHIICYRETEHPTALLLPELLNRFKKRFYAEVEHTRSNDIWSSREELLAYEKALELESLLNEVIEGSEDKLGRKGTKTPARTRDQFITPITPRPGRHYTTPLKTPGSVSNVRSSEIPGVKKEEEPNHQDLPHLLPEEEDLEEQVVEIKKEVIVKKHLDDWIYPKWQEHVANQRAREALRKPPGLERFDTGYVFTRMVNKATRALGPLKEHKKECIILDALLSQSFWRRGKRATWYERRATVLGHLTGQADSAEKKYAFRWQAMEGIKDALLDDDTGTVSRPSLVKRLMKLEKQLQIPPEERSISEGQLRTAVTRTLHATKIANALKFDALGRPIVEQENAPDLRTYIPVIKNESKPEELVVKKNTGKSSWKGRDGQIVNVETRALELYEDQGFTGFHSETKLLTTIFGLLFWDVIFAPVPGAFETRFQVAPLDMFEDTFYHARKGLIDTRLQEIRNDGWREILQKHDDANRGKKTWCIGVSWDLCSKEDLLDIFECIGKDSLAIICQLFCEDYKGRSSGGPDLFVWNARQRTCKFVEVKGPGDRPQENQKYWFDSLLRANVDVEICKVVDDTDDPSVVVSSKKRKAKTPSAKPRRKKNAPAENFSEDEDYDRLDPEPEEGVDFLASNPPDPPSRKRRRISEPNYKFEYPKEVDELPFANTSSSSHVASSPSRRNRVEVVITPSKTRFKKS